MSGMLEIIVIMRVIFMQIADLEGCGGSKMGLEGNIILMISKENLNLNSKKRWLKKILNQKKC